MERHCPWLGSREDSATHYAFPTVENRCSAPKGPATLDLSRQADFCLRDQQGDLGQHTACSFYIRLDSPEALAAPEQLQNIPTLLSSWGKVAIAGAGVVVAVILLAVVSQFIWRSGPAAVVVSPSEISRPSVVSTPILATVPAFPPIVPSALSATPTRVLFPTWSPSVTPTPVTYVVAKGDTLARIASRYGVTVQAIVAANNLKDPNALRVGTVLIIPTGPGFKVTAIPSLQFTPSTPAASATP